MTTTIVVLLIAKGTSGHALTVFGTFVSACGFDNAKRLACATHGVLEGVSWSISSASQLFFFSIPRRRKKKTDKVLPTKADPLFHTIALVLKGPRHRENKENHAQPKQVPRIHKSREECTSVSAPVLCSVVLFEKVCKSTRGGRKVLGKDPSQTAARPDSWSSCTSRKHQKERTCL